MKGLVGVCSLAALVVIGCGPSVDMQQATDYCEMAWKWERGLAPSKSDQVRLDNLRLAAADMSGWKSRITDPAVEENRALADLNLSMALSAAQAGLWDEADNFIAIFASSRGQFCYEALN